MQCCGKLILLSSVCLLHVILTDVISGQLGVVHNIPPKSRAMRDHNWPMQVRQTKAILQACHNTTWCGSTIPA